MKDKPFSSVIEDAFRKAASEHGQTYPDDAAHAWGLVGASYLGFALCGLSSSDLRKVQYSAREQFGPVILDCKWYDGIKADCLEGNDPVNALVPGPDGALCECQVAGQLFLEMLDFCREG